MAPMCCHQPAVSQELHPATFIGAPDEGQAAAWAGLEIEVPLRRERTSGGSALQPWRQALTQGGDITRRPRLQKQGQTWTVAG